MNLSGPSASQLPPPAAEDDTQITIRDATVRGEGGNAQHSPNVFTLSTRSERAETRTEQAETREERANARTEQAEMRTMEAVTRTEQAEARTRQANERTKEAENRTKEAESRNAQRVEELAAGSRKMRILAVDDQTSNTRLVKLCLEQTNRYEVREENNPLAALASAEEFQPDLILLDVMMPGMDGGDLAVSFQASPKLKAVPVVFLTAAITKAEVEAGGGKIGGQAFLAKPIVLTELLACLKQHLGN